MGTTSQKLTYLNDTKTKIRYRINSLGGSLDSDDTFRSYADELESLYNDMPKVSESDVESASLSPTREGAMSIKYKGDTQQDSTTQGKNLFDGETEVGAFDGNGEKTTGATLINKNMIRVSPSTTYRISNNGSGMGVNILSYQSDKTYIGVSQYQSYESFTTSSNTYYINFWRANNLDTIKIQLEQGSSVSSYEPFIPNSPSPDYPQEIHNVSGDNTIEICGKNLFDGSKFDGIVQNANGTYKTTKYYTAASDTIFRGAPNTSYRITLFDEDGNMPSGTNPTNFSMSVNGTWKNITTFSSTTFDTDSSGKAVIKIGAGSYGNIGTANRYIIITPSTEEPTFDDYEPYTGQSQLISLGVKNLIDFNRTQGTYTGNGTTFEEGKYFINMARDSGVGSNTEVVSYQDGILTIKALYNQGIGYPIKCKPNKSYFVKATGGDSNSRLWLSFFTQDGTFISGSDNTQDLQRTAISPSNAYWIIPIFARYGTSSGNTTFSEIKVIEGNKEQYISNTPIELNKIGNYQDYIYKTDKWYLHKEIRKQVLVGTENWQRYSASPNYVFYIDDSIYHNGSASDNPILSDKFKPDFSNNDGNIYLGNSHRLAICTSLETSVDNWKTWLSNNNTLVYYALATPTNTEITDDTLLEQLETIKRSYDGITNISQENNDLPFILDVSALKEWE